MLSSVLPPIDKIPIGQHPSIIRLLRGVFNERPPTRKLIPEWDLPLVLDCLERAPFEPMKDAPLKFITLEDRFPRGYYNIQTLQRSSVSAFRRGKCQRPEERGNLVRVGLSKQDRPIISRHIYLYQL